MPHTNSTVELQREVHRYFWPEAFLNFWGLIIIATAICQITVYSLFIQIQNQFGAGTPWLFPYSITIGALSLCLILYINIKSNSRNLLPNEMIIFAFMFFSLYLAGLVDCALQLFGAGNVSAHCQTYVYHQQYRGESIYTLAWLEQYMICQGWYASFAFYIVGVIFFIWLFVMALVVTRGQVDDSQRFLEED